MSDLQNRLKLIEEIPDKKESSFFSDTDDFSILEEKCPKADCKARSRKPSVYSQLQEPTSSEDSEASSNENEPNISESLVNLHPHRMKKPTPTDNKGSSIKNLLPSKSQTRKFDTNSPGRYDASPQDSVLSARSGIGR